MSSPFGSATLVLHGPSGKVKHDIVGERTTVGRTRDNELVLQDPAVSSHHCEFVAEKAGLVLRDLGSSNGTYVNGRRVQSGPVYDGDAVKIGQYQGRISVQRPDGKPLKAPGAGMAAVAVAGAALLVVVGGLAGWWFGVRQPARQEEALFLEYEAKAKELLEIEPCSAVKDAVDKLRTIDRRLDRVTVGKRGKLTQTETDANAAILTTLRTKEPLLDEAGTRAQSMLDRQKASVDALRKYKQKFRSEELRRTAGALETVFGERAEAGTSFLERWNRYREQVSEYNRLVARLNTGSDKDAADLLDGYRFREEPARVLAECKSSYDKTLRDATLKLADVDL